MLAAIRWEIVLFQDSPKKRDLNEFADQQKHKILIIL